MVFGMSSAAVGTVGAVSAALSAALHFFAASQLLLTEPWPQQANVTDGSSFDFVVVGGGTAGALLAARLSELPGASVLLLEAGGDPPQESIIPGFRHYLLGTNYDWNFTTINDYYSSQALEGGSQRQPRGKMLGGSGSINDMVYARGFPEDYHEWAAIAGDEWNWENVLEYFIKTEHMTDANIVNDPELMNLHGRGGEIEVTGDANPHFETKAFLEAFKELGFEIVKDMTSPNKIGAGRFSHTIRDGQRDSSLTGLLNKAAERDNLHVLKNAFVTKILVENQTAYGVEALYQNEKVTFYARHEVIVSAGTFNTPKLLMLSGIGPKEHLKSLGIDVVQDLPVGENLQDHVMVLNYLVAENGTCHTEQSTYFMDLIRYFHDRSGSFSVSDSMGAYISFDEFQPKIPEFAFYPNCLPMNSGFYDNCRAILGYKESICAQLNGLNENHELLTVAVVLLKPKSRGAVRLKSSDPEDEPLIYSGTFGDERDLDRFPDAMRVVQALAGTRHFANRRARVVELDVGECYGMVAGEMARCEARARGMAAWHAAGTAALGGVLDAHLRVHGLAGLRIADASAMPTVVRGNTNAPVVMIAEKAADFIKRDFAESNSVQ